MATFAEMTGKCMH